MFWVAGWRLAKGLCVSLGNEVVGFFVPNALVSAPSVDECPFLVVKHPTSSFAKIVKVANLTVLANEEKAPSYPIHDLQCLAGNHLVPRCVVGIHKTILARSVPA